MAARSSAGDVAFEKSEMPPRKRMGSGAASALDDADAAVAAHAEEAVGQALWASVLEALRRFEAVEDVRRSQMPIVLED